jgi:hypothetical protein
MAQVNIEHRVSRVIDADVRETRAGHRVRDANIGDPDQHLNAPMRAARTRPCSSRLHATP